MKREKALVQNTVVLGIGYIVPFLVNLIVLPLYTARLSKEQYGIYDFICVVASLLVPVVTLQLKQAAFRFLIDIRTQTNVYQINTILTNVFAYMLPASVIVFVMTILLLFQYTLLVRVLIACYFIAQMYMDTIKQIARGMGHNKEYVFGIVIQFLGCFIFAIAFVYFMDGGIVGVLAANVIAFLGLVIYIIWKLRLMQYIDLKEINVTCLKDMLAFSVPMIFSSISIWIVKLSDRLVVTFFLGVAANGVYAIANKIPNLLSQVFEVFSLAWQENASLTIQDKDSDAYYSDIFQQIYNVLLGMAGGLIVIAPFLFAILVNKQYDEAYYQMPILIIGFLFASLNAYFGGIYIALNKTKIIAYSTMIGAAINLIINVAFIKTFGLYAASISTAISYFVLTWYRMQGLKQYKKMQYHYGNLLIKMIGLMILCCISYIRNPILLVLNVVLGILYAIYINRAIIKTILEMINKKIKK